MTSNEMRQVIGIKPSSDPNADVLRNKNLSVASEERIPSTETKFEEEKVDAGS